MVRSIGGAATFYVDDVAVHELDAVTLSCVAATSANSIESMTGTPWGTMSTLRVDGRDTLTIPSSVLNANEGTLAMWVKFRHATPWDGASQALVSTNWLANGLTIFRIASGALQVYYGTQNDSCTTTVADTNWHCVVLTWKGGACALYLDGAPTAGFVLSGAGTAVLGATLYIGTRSDNANPSDAAILAIITGKKALTAAQVTRLYNLTRVWTLRDA